MNPITFLVLNLLESLHDAITDLHESIRLNERDSNRRMLK
jgi:hypothetical protein